MNNRKKNPKEVAADVIIKEASKYKLVVAFEKDKKSNTDPLIMMVKRKEDKNDEKGDEGDFIFYRGIGDNINNFSNSNDAGFSCKQGAVFTLREFEKETNSEIVFSSADLKGVAALKQTLKGVTSNIMSLHEKYKNESKHVSKESFKPSSSLKPSNSPKPS